MAPRVSAGKPETAEPEPPQGAAYISHWAASEFVNPFGHSTLAYRRPGLGPSKPMKRKRIVFAVLIAIGTAGLVACAGAQPHHGSNLPTSTITKPAQGPNQAVEQAPPPVVAMQSVPVVPSEPADPKLLAQLLSDLRRLRKSAQWDEADARWQRIKAVQHSISEARRSQRSSTDGIELAVGEFEPDHNPKQRPAAPLPEPGSVFGRVVDKLGVGQRAELRLKYRGFSLDAAKQPRDRLEWSDAGGFFEFRVAEPDAYWVTLENLFEFNSLTELCVVVPGGDTVVAQEIVLRPWPSLLVTVTGDGILTAGKRLCATMYDARGQSLSISNVTTDDAARAVFRVIPPGTVIVEFSADWFSGPVRLPLDLQDSGPTDLGTITVRPAATDD